MADPSLGKKRLFPSFSLDATYNKAIIEHEENSYFEQYFGSKRETETGLLFYAQDQAQREKKKKNQAEAAHDDDEEKQVEREEEREGGRRSQEIGGFGEPLVMGLRLGEQTYFEKPSAFAGDGYKATSARRSRSGCRGLRCLVEHCTADLSSAKEYHKKHKVCQIHSKSPKVVVSGMEQRFCQQCSRFHILTEFDDGKRSCRKRLADHNARRRKPQLQPHLLGFSFLQGESGSGKADRFLSPMHPVFQYSSRYSTLPSLWKDAEEIWVEGQNQQSNVITQWANDSGENVSNGSAEHSYYGGFQGSREPTAGRSLFAIDPLGMARISDSSCALSLLSSSSHAPSFHLSTEDSSDLSTHSKLSHLDHFMCEGSSSCPPLPFFVQEKPHFGWASEALLMPPVPYPERVTFSAAGLESLAKDNRIGNATTIGMGFDGGSHLFSMVHGRGHETNT